MGLLGIGLSEAGRQEEALSVREAELAMGRRLGSPEGEILTLRGNLATTYANLGRLEEALQMDQDVYVGRAKLNGEEHEKTLRAANNYAYSLNSLLRFEEARSLIRKTIPVARRVLGDGHILTLKMRKVYAKALFFDGSATLDDLREAVTTLEDIERIARRVLGGAHPLTEEIEEDLRDAQALRAREAPSPSPSGSS